MLVFKSKFDINISVNEVSNFINFKLICKTELLDFIYNYFFLCQNEMIDEEINFIFNTKDMWNYFNFDLLSREDLYNFIFSITERELSYFYEKMYPTKEIIKLLKLVLRLINPLTL